MKNFGILVCSLILNLGVSLSSAGANTNNSTMKGLLNPDLSGQFHSAARVTRVLPAITVRPTTGGSAVIFLNVILNLEEGSGPFNIVLTIPNSHGTDRNVFLVPTGMDKIDSASVQGMDLVISGERAVYKTSGIVSEKALYRIRIFENIDSLNFLDKLIVQ